MLCYVKKKKNNNNNNNKVNPTKPSERKRKWKQKMDCGTTWQTRQIYINKIKKIIMKKKALNSFVRLVMHIKLIPLYYRELKTFINSFTI